MKGDRTRRGEGRIPVSEHARPLAAAGERPTIEIEGVSHVYRRGGVRALDDVSLTLGPGLFGLLGPNGAGKSTLMRVLTTLLVPTSGRARVMGADVVAQPEAVRRVVGYLPQEFGAWRIARVREVLDMMARLSGLDDAAARARRIDEVLELVGLAEVARRRVKALSGGMLRRLGVAQALVHDPPVLIVDEPTVGLDPAERIRFRRLVGDLGRERVILLSTHIVSDLGDACADMAVIDRGRVLFRGSPRELVRRARGRVFDAVVAVDQEARLPEGVEVVSRRPEGVGIRLRLVGAGEAVPAGATPVEEPGLEEAYLAFMLEAGRSAAIEASDLGGGGR
ncbi:MAG: ABC transporter ATP-binding protein [Acidobacteriota bacterium]